MISKYDKFLKESTEDISLSGKGIFTSFLKSLTALGQKENVPNWVKCPDNFLLFYYFNDLPSNDVKEIFSRFKSLSRYHNFIDYQKNSVSLYFGVRCDGNFEYGVCYDKLIPIGHFKLTQTVVKWLCQLESKSAHSIKKELVNMTLNDILVLGSIKNDIISFNPGYFEKRIAPELKDKVLSFGYYGIGKWDSGKIDNNDFLNIKNNFTKWLLSKKWGSKVLINVPVPSSFNLFIHIKLK